MRGPKKKAIVFVLAFIVCIFSNTTCSDIPMRTELNILAGRNYVWKDPVTITAGTDLVANARFGYSVSISSDYAIVGAPGENSNTGAAYIFARNGNTWSKFKRITPNTPVSGSQFGCSVGVDGNYAIVGAYGNSNNSAYIFYKDQGSANNWGQMIQKTGNASSHFGYSVSISGINVIIGSYEENTMRGKAEIFYKDTPVVNGWGLSSTVLNPSPVDGDSLGTSVFISGSYAAAGAPFGNSSRGLVIVYKKTSTTVWDYLQTLNASDGILNDDFGRSVSLTDTNLVVGAPGKQYAYAFQRTGNTWNEISKLFLQNPPSTIGDNFAYSTGIYGNYIILGAYGEGSSKGAAYGYDINKGSWEASANNPLYKPVNRANNDYFGRGSSIYDQYTILGSPGDSSSAAVAGSAQIFHLGLF